VTDALDAGHALDDPQRFLALRLIGHDPAHLLRSVGEGDVDVVTTQVAALAQLPGDGVSHLLMGGLRRRNRGLTPLALEGSGLLCRQGVCAAQPYDDGPQESGTQGHSSILLTTRVGATGNYSRRSKGGQTVKENASGFWYGDDRRAPTNRHRRCNRQRFRHPASDRSLPGRPDFSLPPASSRR